MIKPRISCYIFSEVILVGVNVYRILRPITSAYVPATKSLGGEVARSDF